MLGHGRPVAGGDDLARLRLLASAIASRDVEVAAVAPGEPGWTDGATIYLDPAADPARQVQTLSVQASLLAAGSLAPATVRRLGRRRRWAARYLAVEGHRALVENEEHLPWAVLPLIDREVAAGLEDPAGSLEAAMGEGALTDPPPAFGTIRPREVLAAMGRGAPGAQAPDPTTSPVAVGSPPELDQDDEDQATDAADITGRLLSSPVGGGGPLGRLLQRLLGRERGRGGGGPPGADAPTRLGRGHPGPRPAVVVTGGAATVSDGADEASRRAMTYPEWDVHRHRYRLDWCTVVEEDAPSEGAVPLAMPDGLALRRSLGRLGMGLERRRRRVQGDEIDLDAAVEARVEVLAGAPATEDVYIESVRQRRDLSVLVLLDVSGSAGEPGPGGRPVHEHQRLAAAALTTALHDLGDRVALYAFRSHGRSSVRVLRVKAFDDGLDRRVALRLGGLVPGAYTRLGAAIRHGASIVEERGGTSRRLLVVLSDGFAYDHGYEGRYGEADARRALAEARRRGVGCLCLSVGAGIEAAALRRVFGTAAHASVPSADHLPRIAAPLFGAAIRSADARRRRFQRTERTRERLEIERSRS